jgi:hypothetical protein
MSLAKSNIPYINARVKVIEKGQVYLGSSYTLDSCPEASAENSCHSHNPQVVDAENNLGIYNPFVI